MIRIANFLFDETLFRRNSAAASLLSPATGEMEEGESFDI